MSDTTTVDETAGETPAKAPRARRERVPRRRRHRARTRRSRRGVLLPFLVPLLSIAIVAVLVLNISRVFLSDNKNTALALAIVITLAILVGASLIAAAPRLKTSSLAVILGLVFVGVSLGGLATLGHSLDEGEAAAGQPQRQPARPGQGHGRRRGVLDAQVQRHLVHRAGGQGRVQLQRRHGSHARHPGPRVRRLPAHHRRRRPQEGHGAAEGGPDVHDLLHRARVTRRPGMKATVTVS